MITTGTAAPLATDPSERAIGAGTSPASRKVRREQGRAGPPDQGDLRVVVHGLHAHGHRRAPRMQATQSRSWRSRWACRPGASTHPAQPARPPSRIAKAPDEKSPTPEQMPRRDGPTMPSTPRRCCPSGRERGEHSTTSSVPGPGDAPRARARVEAAVFRGRPSGEAAVRAQSRGWDPSGAGGTSSGRYEVFIDHLIGAERATEGS